MKLNIAQLSHEIVNEHCYNSHGWESGTCESADPVVTRVNSEIAGRSRANNNYHNSISYYSKCLLSTHPFPALTCQSWLHQIRFLPGSACLNCRSEVI